MNLRTLFQLPLIAVVAFAASSFAVAATAPAQPRADAEWFYFTTPERVRELQQTHDNLLIVDVRSPEQYREGHIPGAINLPGADWRTPKAKPSRGESQYLFRNPDGSPDIARYEQLLSEAGIGNQHHVIIYGNHAGKSDGSIPAMILRWLGHEKVQFLDGLGLEQWQKAGYPVSTEIRVAEPAVFRADPVEGFVWNLKDVQENLRNPEVLFYDTRSVEEYTGVNLRDNRRGGRIPGAVLCDYADFLTEDKTVKSSEAVREILSERGITPDKTIVLYCQTSTRVSLPYLALTELGYDDVVVYDASWHEYGNRDDTLVETEEATETELAEQH